MKKTAGVETGDTDSSTEIERLIINTPSRLSEQEVQNSKSASVMSEEVACQMKAITDPLTQQLAHLYQVLHELKNEQASRRHQDASSFKTATRYS